MRKWILVVAVLVGAVFTAYATQTAQASSWPSPPPTRQGCDARPNPPLCKVHWWVRAVHRREKSYGLSRTTYHYVAERHPSEYPYLRTRKHWRSIFDSLHQSRPWSQTWYADALCVHSHEGAWNDDTGNGFYGGLQFDYGTWLSNGGGRFAPTANLASPLEQLEVAYTTWKSRGWEPWPNTARMCGLL